MRRQLPGAFRNGVIHRWFFWVTDDSCLLMTTGPHVFKDEPVSYRELRKKAALHHLVQSVTRRTPQTTGEHRLVCWEWHLQTQEKNPELKWPANLFTLAHFEFSLNMCSHLCQFLYLVHCGGWNDVSQQLANKRSKNTVAQIVQKLRVITWSQLCWE